MRKQYFFRPSESGFDAWDVHRLIELSSTLAVVEIPLDSLSDLDTAYWFGADGSPPTVRLLVRHMELVRDADPSYPILLDVQGRVMDGMHRVARAVLLGLGSISARQFPELPSPDYVDVRLESLPYDRMPKGGD